jgi:hypothetical protein
MSQDLNPSDTPRMFAFNLITQRLRKSFLSERPSVGGAVHLLTGAEKYAAAVAQISEHYLINTPDVSVS